MRFTELNPVGTNIEGTIERKKHFGFFVKLATGVTGLFTNPNGGTLLTANLSKAKNRGTRSSSPWRESIWKGTKSACASRAEAKTNPGAKIVSTGATSSELCDFAAALRRLKKVAYSPLPHAAAEACDQTTPTRRLRVPMDLQFNGSSSIDALGIVNQSQTYPFYAVGMMISMEPLISGEVNGPRLHPIANHENGSRLTS
ncbi:MAG: hypothetical protein H6624_01850 [Bdellovibrionaceae bacterium]|nr:hypothetical protein [Pseudobdellovibrionaceae bacterium]